MWTIGLSTADPVPDAVVNTVLFSMTTNDLNCIQGGEGKYSKRRWIHLFIYLFSSLVFHAVVKNTSVIRLGANNMVWGLGEGGGQCPIENLRSSTDCWKTVPPKAGEEASK